MQPSWNYDVPTAYVCLHLDVNALAGLPFNIIYIFMLRNVVCHVRRCGLTWTKVIVGGLSTTPLQQNTHFSIHATGLQQDFIGS
jgi:hypothetical protein